MVPPFLHDQVFFHFVEKVIHNSWQCPICFIHDKNQVESATRGWERGGNHKLNRYKKQRLLSLLLLSLAQADLSWTSYVSNRDLDLKKWSRSSLFFIHIYYLQGTCHLFVEPENSLTILTIPTGQSFTNIGVKRNNIATVDTVVRSTLLH